MRAHAAPPPGSFLDFIRSAAPRLPEPPATSAAWDARLASVAAGLRRSFGRMPESLGELDPEVLGTLRRDGYAIDRLTFQTRPGVRITANVYRPDPAPPGRLPAVLNVHGHWSGARLDPVVQSRCLGLARLGYLCLVVDAFGAGERAVDPVPGAYHGGLLGASLWPTGLSLLGIQVQENRRAVDYLISREDVDPSKLGITGCSGGGNQTLYAGATDPRLAAVVPVCSIGTYQSYLGAACCVCEVNPGSLSYASTGDVLALMAPRALLVINASRDAIQFSPGEAEKSVEYAKARYRSLGRPDSIRRMVFESGHDYSRPMREALYGWLDLHLRGRGDGTPVSEPDFRVEDPRDLRCYPEGASRPKTIVTIPQLALSEGRARLAALPAIADHPRRWEADRERLRAEILDRLRIPTAPLSETEVPNLADVDRAGPVALKIAPEPGLSLSGTLWKPEAGNRRGKVLLLRPEGEAPPDDPTLRALLGSGWSVLTVDLRAIGRNRPDRPGVRGIPDHDSAEWSLWVGRPLLGQWVRDAATWHRLLDRLGSAAGGPEPKAGRSPILAVGPFGLVGLLASGSVGPASEPSPVGILGGLTSLVGEGPWKDLSMGLLAPGLLEMGDVGHFAALIAPRSLAIAGGSEPDGQPVSRERLESAYEPARSIYRALNVPERFHLSPSADLEAILAAWNEPG